MKKAFLTTLVLASSLLGRAETITLDITDADAFANWTVIDANSDGTVWTYSDKNAMYHSGNAANDWLISPAVELKAGTKYDITATLRVETSTPRWSFHDFSVYIGDKPEVDAQTTKILEQTGAEYSLDPKEYKGSFTPESDGTYYVSVRCTSSGWNDDLYFYGFTLQGNDAGAGDEDVVTVALPYSEDFSTNNHGYTFFHGNSESRDWDVSSQRLRYYGKNYYTSDAYAATPAFYFESGKNYELTFRTWISSSGSNNYKPLKVKLGKKADIDSLTEELFSETIQSTTQTTKKVNFTVDTDGVYYLAFWSGGDLNANDILVDDVTVKELLTLPMPATALNVTPAEKGALQAEISWTNPTKTNTGESLETITKAVITRDGTEIGTVTENLTPGAISKFTDNHVEAPGTHRYDITLFLGENASEAASVTSPWIGKDTSVGNVTNVVATVVDDHTVNLTFNPVTTGTNGGYVDSADIAYRIDRKAGSASAVTIEDNWSGELPYINRDVNGLNSYTYSVYTIYQGQNVTSSWNPPTSNAVILGGGVDIPYSQDFSDTSSHFFTFFHGNGSTRDWTVSPSKYLDYWGNPADAYAVTPRINMEAGKAYRLTFSTWRSGTSKPLYVRIGKEATAEGLDTQLFFENIDNGVTNVKTIDFSVAQDDAYYIAFHCFGTVDGYNDLYVDNIKIEEIPVSPLPATEFTIKAAEKGALSAVLTWINPSEDNTGSQLSAITKAVINRGNNQIAVIEENLVPGQEMSFTDDTIETAGEYTYDITLYIADNASDKVSAKSSWIGPDTPQAPQNAAVNLDEEQTTITITWDAVSETGVHGGYVDTSSIQYHVVRMPDQLVVADAISETSATDNVAELALGFYYYQISVIGYPDLVANTEKTLLGEAIEVTEDNPYTPDFTNADTFDLWTLTNGGNGTGLWSYKATSQTLETGFISNTPWALTPPLSLKAGTYKVSYKATCYSARYTSNIAIHLTNAPSHDASYNELIHSAAVTSVSYPSVVEVEFTVPVDGIYYIGYVDVTSDHWKLALSQANVELVKLAPVATPPYEFTFNSEEDSQDWTFVSDEENGWVYNADEHALEAASGSPMIFTPVFKAVVGKYKLTYQAFNKFEDEETGFDIYLVKQHNPLNKPVRRAPSLKEDDMTLIHTSALTTMAEDNEFVFDIDNEGYYHIGFKRKGNDENSVYLTSHTLAITTTSVNDLTSDKGALSYDSISKTIRFANDTLYVYDACGSLIGTLTDGTFDMTPYARGIYIARCGSDIIKFVK